MNKRLTSLPAVFIALTLAISSSAEAAESKPLRLDLTDPGWEFSGEGTIVQELDGQLALRLMSGHATYRDLEFLDGTIEFDLQVTELRSFAYLYFRMLSDDEHEEFYFRPHKSLLPDAVQYTPVYKGSSQWQLYHDADFTAAARFPSNEWIPVKVVVEGTQAAVFVGDVAQPQLVVPKLARKPAAGYLALRSFMTFGTPPDTYVANFANVTVTPGVIDYEFPEPAATAADLGVIDEWLLSSSFAPAEGDILELPAEVLASDAWTAVAARDDGLVELERFVDRPEGVRRASVVARLKLTAAQATTRRLNLGFSDEISVFLNGRLLVVDDQSYSFNLPRRQGLWRTGQLSLFLPLEEGTNDLAIVVTDRFGGWALSGLLEGGAGVEVDGR